MKIPLTGTNKKSTSKLNDLMVTTLPSTKDFYRNTPLGSKIDRRSSSKSLDEGFIRPKSFNTAIAMARMITNNQTFNSSMADDGSECGPHAEGALLKEIEDYNNGDYDGDSITDYDGTGLDIENNHQQNGKKVLPPPSREAPMTHHVEFDPVHFGREVSNCITKQSEEEHSSSGKNSVTSFSDKTSGESSSKRRRSKKTSDSKVKNIVRKETKKIKRWKLVAIITVCAVGLVASAWTFYMTYQKYDTLRKNMIGQGRKDDPFFYKAVFDFEERALHYYRESVKRLEVISRALTEDANRNRISVVMDNNTQTFGEPKPTFPFVTMPRFSEMAQDMSEDMKRNETRGIDFFQRIFWAPLVDPLSKEDWEQYTLNHQGWMTDFNGVERIDLRDTHESGVHNSHDSHNHKRELLEETIDGIWSDQPEYEVEYFDPNQDPLTNFSPEVHADFVPSTCPRKGQTKRYQFSQDENFMTYLPVWQTFDFDTHEETVCNPNFVNLDLFTWFTKAAKDVRDARDISLFDDDYFAVGDDLPDGIVHAWVDDAFADIHNHGHRDRGMECCTTMFLRVPVYDSFSTPNTIGYVFAALNEEIGFIRESAVDSGLEGFPLRLVVKEERNGRPILARKRTYEINGSEVKLIAEGKEYDKQFDDMFYEFKLKTESEGSSSSTLFTIYPTEKFFEILNAGTKKSNGPMSMSIGYNYPAVPAVWTASLVASVFAVILIVFVCYDNSVEDRQRKLLRQAERTDAIVGSMFPANIQGRLMMIDDDTIESSQKNRVTLKHGGAEKQNEKFPQILSGFDASANSLPPITDVEVLGASLNNSSVHTATDSNTSYAKQTTMMTRMARKPGNRNRNQMPMPSPQASVEMKLAPSPIDESLLRFGNSKPMADFYPNTTILMCDIAGFTAWSSARAPADVFRLLETIYGAFDDIARAEKVFKVETVGDCYVACAGLPVKQPKHAVIMAKFAKKTLKRYDTLIKKLETYLGPDTVDLGLRMGIHSGPVTAGVLRGDKTRFQLFGDTVNTASRMESTGRVNMIQVSPQTANLLKEEGFGKWVIPREHLVEVKGKGMMQTYWLLRSGTTMGSERSQTSSCANSISSPKLTKGGAIFKGAAQRRNSMGASNASWETSSTGTQSSGSVQSHPQRRHSNNENAARNSKERRLIEWMVETFMKSLKKMATHRALKKTNMQNEEILNGKELTFDVLHPEAQIIEEIKEVIPIRRKESLTNGTLDANENNMSLEGSLHVAIPRVVERQLRDFITVVSLLYHDHAFHNFEHCAHVLMSVSKLLSRILESKLRYSDSGCDERDDAYGITSDPLLEFACIFSALIHDVDHSGVPNSQLVKENTTTAVRYHNRSVAEQHSIAVAWSLLMQPCYRELRECIYRTRREFDRFRQLVVNSVMATDIMNGDLKKFRDNRWEKAFNLKNDSLGIERSIENANRMATVVIEHMIQASDIAHTMQHWHVYLKFNERLFKENYQAFKDGRAEKDPSTYWYEGELNFFKFYIIPLALKLKECGVFGVSGDEYFFHAESNRSEWALKGKEVVEGYMGRASRDSSRNSSRSNSPNPLLAKQLVKLPEGKESSFRGDRGTNPLV